MRDHIRSNAFRVRVELYCWVLLLVACLACTLLLAAGCKSADVAKTLSTTRVEYTNYDGGFSGTQAAPYSYPGHFSGDTSGDSIGVSIQPFAALYDEQKGTREAVERLYELAAENDRRNLERAAIASQLPFVVPEAPSIIPPAAPEPPPAPQHTDLPWWKDTALLIGYATIIGAIVAGMLKGWKTYGPHAEKGTAP